ncbi:hypothetical protein B0T17DRAFT_529634 [Bombardia bombarda]|uniref:Uncharacterized protein n=1 Tax=Bombardia bombarda TaxID=252184 RepID=A0AA39XBL8_9PEZI|nr:hypothetical protein B0T17DRAFT_529634 [Bombardia bombarda]
MEQQAIVLDMESLPTEVIASVLDSLAPQPPEIGETRPASYHKLVAGETWFDFTRNRRGLASLCLVSRRLQAMALPRLYRTMCILDEESMMLYFRTLTERPQYGLLTRYLSCHMTLTRDAVIREMRRAVGKLLRTFRPVDEPQPIMEPLRRVLDVMARALPHPSTHACNFDDVPQVIFACILNLLPNLNTLLLQVPICDHPEYTALLSKVATAHTHFRDPVVTALLEPHLVPLQRIETLQLQGDPELLKHFEDGDCRECEAPEVWGAQPRRYVPLYDCLPALHTLEVTTDDGIWDKMHDEMQGHSYLCGPASAVPDDSAARPPYLPGIRHIYLHNSIACPRNLYQILVNAPKLETLYMTPYRDESFYREEREDGMAVAHPRALDVALAKHAKNLTHLDVSWFDVYRHKSLIGPDGRLASLPGLKQLEKLCIQLATLYGDVHTALEIPLADLLPPNLVELTLEDWWWTNLDDYNAIEEWGPAKKLTHYRNQKEYRESALMMLGQFARDFRQRMPKLERMMLLCKIPYTWMVEEGVPIEFHFEDIKAALGMQGVEFVVEEECM